MNAYTALTQHAVRWLRNLSPAGQPPGGDAAPPRGEYASTIADIDHTFPASTNTRLAAAVRLVSCFAAAHIVLQLYLTQQQPYWLLPALIFLFLFTVYVGLLYWRTDLLDHAPSTFDELSTAVARARREHGPPFGLVWSGARYEGLVTVFLEYLHGFGGRFLDATGHAAVDSDAGIRALTAMRDSIYRDLIVPRDVLAWQEEQTRFAFQSGRAVAMRNWPYAHPLLADRAASQVAEKFAVALMPHARGGRSAATLGGQQLAINARSRRPDAAYALVKHLTSPEEMLERARVAGEYPARPALYDRDELAAAIAASPAQIRRVIEQAVPRPVTPVYAELSELLQVQLHRALTRQREPADALHDAANAMNALLVRARLVAE